MQISIKENSPFCPDRETPLARAQEYIHLNRNGEWRVNSRAKFIKTLHPPSYSVWLTVQKAASVRELKAMTTR